VSVKHLIKQDQEHKKLISMLIASLKQVNQNRILTSLGNGIEKGTLSNNNQKKKSYYKRSIVKYIILLTSTACILALQNIGYETAHISKILDAPFHRSSAFLTKKKHDKQQLMIVQM
jgi:hypothetical protein